jgi:hypothetical protein
MDAPSNVSSHENEKTKVNFDELIEALDKLTEQLWHELGGKVSLQRVREVVAETATEYYGATVTQYIPLLVRRGAAERLAQEISRVKPETRIGQAEVRQYRE